MKQNIAFVIVGLIFLLTLSFQNCGKQSSVVDSVNQGSSNPTTTLSPLLPHVSFLKSNCTLEATSFSYKTDSVCLKIFNVSYEVSDCSDTDNPERSQHTTNCSDSTTFVQLKSQSEWTYNSQNKTWTSVSSQIFAGPVYPPLNGTYTFGFRDPVAGNVVQSKSYTVTMPNLAVTSSQTSWALNDTFQISIANVGDLWSEPTGLYSCLEEPGSTNCTDRNHFVSVKAGAPATYAYDVNSMTYTYRESFGSANKPAGNYKFYYRRGSNVANPVVSITLALAATTPPPALCKWTLAGPSVYGCAATSCPLAPPAADAACVCGSSRIYSNCNGAINTTYCEAPTAYRTDFATYFCQ